jgi:hypothetical protein
VLGAALAAGSVVVAAIALRPPYLVSKWDLGGEHTTPYQHRLAAWLAENTTSEELLLSPLWPPTHLQPKTGHPVLFDAVTLLTMTYKASLAPAVITMLRDLYGHDYWNPESVRRLRGADGVVRPSTASWIAPWRTRRCPEWIAVGARYNVRLVLSTTALPLDLPAVLPGDGWTLYAIPADPAACAAPVPR